MNHQSTPANVGSNDELGAWVPAHERVPATGTECVVLLRYSLGKPPFVSIDTWDVQREDPAGMGGPTIETGVGWDDNDENDVIAWIAIPSHPPADWDERLRWSEAKALNSALSGPYSGGSNDGLGVCPIDATDKGTP